MVMMGMQRIVIDSGSINASMRFHIDTRSAATEDRGSQFSMQNRVRGRRQFRGRPMGRQRRGRKHHQLRVHRAHPAHRGNEHRSRAQFVGRAQFPHRLPAAQSDGGAGAGRPHPQQHNQPRRDGRRRPCCCPSRPPCRATCSGRRSAYDNSGLHVGSCSPGSRSRNSRTCDSTPPHHTSGCADHDACHGYCTCRKIAGCSRTCGHRYPRSAGSSRSCRTACHRICGSRITDLRPHGRHACRCRRGRSRGYGSWGRGRRCYRHRGRWTAGWRNRRRYRPWPRQHASRALIG